MTVGAFALNDSVSALSEVERGAQRVEVIAVVAEANATESIKRSSHRDSTASLQDNNRHH